MTTPAYVFVIAKMEDPMGAIPEPVEVFQSLTDAYAYLRSQVSFDRDKTPIQVSFAKFAIYRIRYTQVGCR